jgi:hypothetical protein
MFFVFSSLLLCCFFYWFVTVALSVALKLMQVAQRINGRTLGRHVLQEVSLFAVVFRLFIVIHHRLAFFLIRSVIVTDAVGCERRRRGGGGRHGPSARRKSGQRTGGNEGPPSETARRTHRHSHQPPAQHCNAGRRGTPLHQFQTAHTGPRTGGFLPHVQPVNSTRFPRRFLKTPGLCGDHETLKITCRESFLFKKNLG